MEQQPERPPLRTAELRAALLRPDGWWTALRVVERTGSTNTDVAAAARDGAAEGLAVVAEHQSAGRGRAGRTWESVPRSGLAVSVLLRPGADPAVPRTRWGWLPLLAGVALVGAVDRATGLEACLKWPNDLLVGGRKCAGVLTEVVAGAEAAVIGIGLNVSHRPEELPAPAPGALPATSLALAGAPGTDRTALLVALLAEVAEWYGRWREQAGDPETSGLREAYLRRCATVGVPVRVRLSDGEELAGAADTVDTAGQLVLRTGAGRRAFAAGDITHLRPAPPG